MDTTKETKKGKALTNTNNLPVTESEEEKSAREKRERREERRLKKLQEQVDESLILDPTQTQQEQLETTPMTSKSNATLNSTLPPSLKFSANIRPAQEKQQDQSNLDQPTSQQTGNNSHSSSSLYLTSESTPYDLNIQSRQGLVPFDQRALLQTSNNANLNPSFYPSSPRVSHTFQPQDEGPWDETPTNTMDSKKQKEGIRTASTIFPGHPTILKKEDRTLTLSEFRGDDEKLFELLNALKEISQIDGGDAPYAHYAIGHLINKHPEIASTHNTLFASHRGIGTEENIRRHIAIILSHMDPKWTSRALRSFTNERDPKALLRFCSTLGIQDCGHIQPVHRHRAM